MTPEEFKGFNAQIAQATVEGNTTVLIGCIARSLNQIAAAQEAVVALAQQDMDDAINEAVEERAQQLHAQNEEEKSRRSFIGKKA